ARVGDDIEIYRNASRREAQITWHNLRQQNQKPTGNANQCLADFVAPKESGVPDWVRAVAARLAEAFAEHLHERVRREYWGYAPDESLGSEELIAEKYRGIRPAPGYPACPDHTEKAALFALLDAPKNAGMTLTESYAMLPAAAVSGFYLSHPAASYFAVGKIGRDQI